MPKKCRNFAPQKGFSVGSDKKLREKGKKLEEIF